MTDHEQRLTSMNSILDLAKASRMIQLTFLHSYGLTNYETCDEGLKSLIVGYFNNKIEEENKKEKEMAK